MPPTQGRRRSGLQKAIVGLINKDVIRVHSRSSTPATTLDTAITPSIPLPAPTPIHLSSSASASVVRNPTSTISTSSSPLQITDTLETRQITGIVAALKSLFVDLSVARPHIYGERCLALQAWDQLGDQAFGLLLRGITSQKVIDEIRVTGAVRRSTIMMSGDVIDKDDPTGGIYLDCGIKGMEWSRECEGYLGSAGALSRHHTTGFGRRIQQHESASYRKANPSAHYRHGYMVGGDDDPRPHTYIALFRIHDQDLANILGLTRPPSPSDLQYESYRSNRLHILHAIEAILISALGLFRTEALDAYLLLAEVPCPELVRSPMNRAPALEPMGSPFDTDTGRAAGKLALQSMSASMGITNRLVSAYEYQKWLRGSEWDANQVNTNLERIDKMNRLSYDLKMEDLLAQLLQGTRRIALTGLGKWIRLDIITSEFVHSALTQSMPTNVPSNWAIPSPFRLSLPRDQDDSWKAGDVVVWKLVVPGGRFDERTVELQGSDPRGRLPNIIANFGTMAMADQKSKRGKKNRFKYTWSLAVKAFELMTVLRKSI